MLHIEFGKDPENLAPLRALLDSNVSVDNLSAQLNLLEAYQVGFDIFDHDSPEATHLDLFAFHPKETMEIGSLLESKMRRFVKARVGECYNISWLEFISQSRAECDRMFRVCEDMLVKNEIPPRLPFG